jgi:hypothetical protein
MAELCAVNRTRCSTAKLAESIGILADRDAFLSSRQAPYDMEHNPAMLAPSPMAASLDHVQSRAHKAMSGALPRHPRRSPG